MPNNVDLLAVAKTLAAAENANDLHFSRSISTTYYAVFETLRSECSALLLGFDDDLSRARTHVERSIGHKEAKKRCKSCASNGEFPTEIREFSDTFASLYEERIKADYDRPVTFTKEDAESWISRATSAIESLNNSDEKHRRAFVAWVCFDPRDQ